MFAPTVIAVGQVACGLRKHAAQGIRVVHEMFDITASPSVVGNPLPVAMRILEKAQDRVVDGRAQRGAMIAGLAHVGIERTHGFGELHRVLALPAPRGSGCDHR